MSTLALVMAILMQFEMLPTFNIFGMPMRTRMLIIEDDLGEPRILMTTRPDNAPGIIFLDSRGTTRIELALTPTDSPGLSLLSPTGKSMLTATLRAQKGHPELTFSDLEGVRKWRLILDENGDPQIIDGSEQ